MPCLTLVTTRLHSSEVDISVFTLINNITLNSSIRNLYHETCAAELACRIHIVVSPTM